MHTTTIGWRVQLGTATALSIMAAVAVRVDILNNWQYGLTISAELASILVLAAVAVVAVPVAASILGWSRHLRITAAICVALTVWSAVNAYSAKQGAAILAAQSSQAAYSMALADAQAAREEAATARKEAAGISETMSADALADLVAQARAKYTGLTTTAQDRGTTCTAMKACRAAETDLGTLTQRHGQAKAKAEALVRAEKADAKVAAAKIEAKAGPAEASMVATVIAGQIGADASAVARYMALALTGLGIAVTQLVALLGGQAASLIGGAVKQRAAERAAKAAAEPAPAGAADPATAELDLLARIKALVRAQPDRVLRMSIRELADELGVKRATLGGKLGRYRNNGALDVKVEGKGRASATVIRLPTKKKAA